MKPLLGLAGGYATLVLLAVCAFFVHPRPRAQGYALTVIVGVTGVVLGWLIGLLVSPYESEEAARFAALATAATSFVSGYLVSKVDPAITEALSRERIAAANVVYVMRILVFVSCAVVGAITMYSFRAYIGDQGAGNQASSVPGATLPQPPDSARGAR